VRATLSPADLGQSWSAGLLCRAQDANNALGARISPSGELVMLFKLVGGVFTNLGVNSFTPGPSCALRVACTHTTIRCYVNDDLLITATNVTDFLTATRHGLYAFDAPPAAWDDFSITEALPPPTITLALSPTAQRISTATTHTVLGTTSQQGLREPVISYRGAP
jgi:hypothetical protein